MVVTVDSAIITVITLSSWIEPRRWQKDIEKTALYPVEKGKEVTWFNEDDINHRIVINLAKTTR